MTEYRSIDQIQADFTRVAPGFTQVADIGTLIGLLTDNPLGDAAVYASGGGPVLYDLGVLDGPDWEGVHRFLNSRLVTPDLRTQFRQFESDLHAADADGDGFVNNKETVLYAQSHTDRWPNIAVFRNAADVFLNRLPAYLSQTKPHLDDQQISRLWGVLNFLANENNRFGVAEEKRGTVYGISLAGFPSNDTNNPPDLIRRAMAGTLTPEEIAAVHPILKVEFESGNYSFSDTAPFSPMEIGVLGTVLEAAAVKGHDFHGMTLLAGDAESSSFAARNEAAAACSDGIHAAKDRREDLAKAFQDCATSMAAVEADQPGKIGVKTLLMRAYTGDLSPAETKALRTWMEAEAKRLGMVCDGTLACMKKGAVQVFKNIAQDPWHFAARNGAFLGGAYLYKRLILRNAVQRRLEKACGGPIANPRQAYRDYENFLAEQMKKSGIVKRFFNQVIKNPNHKGFLGKAFIGFPVTFLHLAAFNVIADKKDQDNLLIDIPTDLLLLPLLFDAWDSYDAFKNSSLEKFAAANPGICKPAEAVTAPAPETVAAVQSASVAEFSMFPAASDLEERFPGVVTQDNGGLIYRYQAEIDGVPVGLSQPLASQISESRGLRFDSESFFYAGEFTSAEFEAALQRESAAQTIQSLRLKGVSGIEVPSVSAVSTEEEATAAAANRVRSGDPGRVNGVPGRAGQAAPVRAPVFQPNVARVVVP